MAERRHLDPDVGYWAERWDPEGTLHPLAFTMHLNEKWVNVATLPVLYAALPLYRLGGYRLALLLPMAGSVLAALAGRALARRVGGGDGWAAFWIVGLASPLALYALDFWEHSLGVAAVAWAAVLLFDSSGTSRTCRRSFSAGLLLGIAATVRTEALVYAVVAVAVVAAATLASRPTGRATRRALALGALVSVGMVVPLLANLALEHATVGTNIRVSRTAGAAAGAGNDAESRIEEGIVTTVAAAGDGAGIVLGVGILAVLVIVGRRGDRQGDPRFATAALAGTAVLYALRFLQGPSFVPGLVPATPLATLPFARWSIGGRRIVPFAVAVVAIPLVVAFQPRGGALPQWAGRYLLPSGLLLAVLGTVLLPELAGSVRVAFVGLAVAVTAFGLTWLSVRSHGVAQALAALDRRPEPVIVSRVVHLAREGGAFYGRKRWLTVQDEAGLRLVNRVLDEAGVDQFALAEEDGSRRQPTRVPGFEASSTDVHQLFEGVNLRITAYRRTVQLTPSRP